MLEQMRKQGASIFVYLIFCLLIAIFVINFRPGQSRNDDNGCRGTSNVVLSVDGTDSTQTAYKVAYSNPYNRAAGKSKTYTALETLIRREMLADAAEERGMMATEDLVMEEIRKGHYYLGGQRTMIPGIFFDSGEWNLKAFNSWVSQLNVSRNAYIEEQRRSLLASMMAEILSESVQVSRDEALHRFINDGNTVTYDVVAFKPDVYRAAMKITDADVDRFVATHGDEVSARYKSDERTYKGTKPALKLRQIYIAKLEKPAEPPKDEKKADVCQAYVDKAWSLSPTKLTKEEFLTGCHKQVADGKTAPVLSCVAGAKDDAAAKLCIADAQKAIGKAAADDFAKAVFDSMKPGEKKDDKKTADAKKVVKPVGMPIDEAKAKLDAARTAIAGNKQKFIDAAKELSSDEAAKSVGGDLGWHTVDNAMLGDKALNDAVKTLKPGDVSPVIVTDRGVYLVMAEDKREGDLSFDQVKREIAQQLAKDVWGKEAAKRAAIAALDGATKGIGMSLEQLYEKDAPSSPNNGGFDIEQLMNDPNIPEDQKQKIREMIEKQKHGALEVPEKDIPAGWFEDGSETGSAATANGGSAAGKGSAAPAPTTGAGAGAGAVPPMPPAGSGAGAPIPAPPPAPVEVLTASKDQLPAMSEVGKAHVSRFGPSPRAKQMPGLGQSKEAVTAVFDELQPNNLAKQIYEADGSYIVIQLIAKSQANIADFDKDADRRVSELRTSRGQEFLEEWLKNKCETLAKDGKIKPQQELLIEHDDKGKILPIGYKPCMSFR